MSVHERCWAVLLFRQNCGGETRRPYLRLHSKSLLTSHEDQTCLLGSWFPVHLYCSTEWASHKCWKKTKEKKHWHLETLSNTPHYYSIQYVSNCTPWVSKFLLFLDVAVCVKISMELPLVKLVNLLLGQNKQISEGRVMRLTPLSRLRGLHSVHLAGHKLNLGAHYAFFQPVFPTNSAHTWVCMNGAVVNQVSDTSGKYLTTRFN